MAPRDDADPRPAPRWPLLVGCVLLCQAAGALGALGMRGEATWTWYRALAKPPITPPDWVFSPVWTILYLLMGIALWQVLRYGAGRPERRAAVGLFLAQLALNALWTPLFFWWRHIGGALAVLAALLVLLALTLRAFARLHPPAAWLLAPYAAWATFALVLNAWLWQLNG
ncbi:MAG: TspO/MBR family protein [Planctomycetota bacterium]